MPLENVPTRSSPRSSRPTVSRALRSSSSHVALGSAEQPAVQAEHLSRASAGPGSETARGDTRCDAASRGLPAARRARAPRRRWAARARAGASPPSSCPPRWGRGSRTPRLAARSSTASSPRRVAEALAQPHRVDRRRRARVRVAVARRGAGRRPTAGAARRRRPARRRRRGSFSRVGSRHSAHRANRGFPRRHGAGPGRPPTPPRKPHSRSQPGGRPASHRPGPSARTRRTGQAPAGSSAGHQAGGSPRPAAAGSQAAQQERFDLAQARTGRPRRRTTHRCDAKGGHVGAAVPAY